MKLHVTCVTSSCVIHFVMYGFLECVFEFRNIMNLCQVLCEFSFCGGGKKRCFWDVFEFLLCLEYVASWNVATGDASDYLFVE